MKSAENTILSQDFASFFEKTQFKTSRLLNQSLIKPRGVLNRKILLSSSRLSNNLSTMYTPDFLEDDETLLQGEFYFWLFDTFSSRVIVNHLQQRDILYNYYYHSPIKANAADRRILRYYFAQRKERLARALVSVFITLLHLTLTFQRVSWNVCRVTISTEYLYPGT